jgi:hypothetical protein
MRVEKRDTPLPVEMQGRWIVDDEPTSILVVDGGEVTCFGAVVDYDYKEIDEIEGALTVNLRVDDEAAEYDFNRQNIIGLVITPEGEFLGFNTKFSASFTRDE